MNEQADNTNQAWAVGTMGALAGAMVTGQSFAVQTGVLALGAGGNAGHRVYQETGDQGMAMEVGTRRAVSTAAAQYVGLVGMVLAALGFGMPILGIMGGSSTSWAVPFVLLLLPAWACWKYFRKVWAENERLAQTGRPDAAAFHRAGWTYVGGADDLWVKPHPGYTVADVLRSAGITNVIEVTTKAPFSNFRAGGSAR